MPSLVRVTALGLALAMHAGVAGADPGAVAARFPAYIDGHGRLQLGASASSAAPGQHRRDQGNVQRSVRAARRPANRVELLALIRDVALSHGLEPALLQAVVQVESGFNPDAVSPRGAVGLMQLMPATAQRFAVRDRRDVQQNLQGGAAYLAWLLRHFNQDLRLAVAAYNAGEGAVRRAGNQVPAWTETQAYVQRVAAVYGGPL